MYVALKMLAGSLGSIPMFSLRVSYPCSTVYPTHPVYFLLLLSTPHHPLYPESPLRRYQETPPLLIPVSRGSLLAHLGLPSPSVTSTLAFQIFTATWRAKSLSHATHLTIR